MKLVFEASVGIHEADFLAVGGLVDRLESMESELVACRFVSPYGGGGTIPEKAEADEDAWFIIQIECGGGDFYGDRRDSGSGICSKDASRGLKEWQCSAASESEEVLEERVGFHAKAFRDMAGKTRAEVSGAGADKEGIDGRGRGAGAFAGGQEGIRREVRCVGFEVVVEFSCSGLEEG